jgi:hypothetical protein
MERRGSHFAAPWPAKAVRKPYAPGPARISIVVIIVVIRIRLQPAGL